MYNEAYLKEIAAYLVRSKETLAVAESVTSGHLQAAFSITNDTTLFFQGGITVYNLHQKYTHLHIDPAKAIGCNCVSEEIARQMAVNASKLFSSHWGIGITGYATPIPEEGITDLYAFAAISYKENCVFNTTISCSESTILKTQLFYTNSLLEKFTDLI